MSTLQFGCSICQNLYIRADEPGFVDIYRKKDDTLKNADDAHQADVDMDTSEATNFKNELERRKPFKLELLPDDVKCLVLTKMDQISFIRTRRTNKAMNSYIQEKRRQLKVPLFHNWKASVRGETITISNALLPVNDFTIGENFKGEFDEAREIPKTYDMDVLRNERFGNPAEIVPVRNEAKVYLNAWKMNEELKNELTGNIRFTSFDISGIKPNVQDAWLEFITANMHSHATKIHSIPPEVIAHCLSRMAPKSLTVYSSDVITLGYGLEFVKTLYLKEVQVKPNIKSLKNVETLEFQEPIVGEHWFDVMDMVKTWCRGENKLREMLYSAKKDMRAHQQAQAQGQQPEEDKVNLGQLCCYGESLEKHVLDAFVQPGGPLYTMATKAFSRDMYMNQRPTPEAFVLNQITSNKKAICLSYGTDVLFSVVEEEHQELLNTPKPEEPVVDQPADAADDDADDDNDADDDDEADVADAGNEADGADDAAHDNNADDAMDADDANVANDADNANDATD